MGQTIGFMKYLEDGKKEWAKVPEWYDGKWTGRWEWFIEIFSGEYEERDRDTYIGDSYVRPKDFSVFRADLDALSDEEVIKRYWPSLDMQEVRSMWKECTDWLETNPDVFVNYG